MFKLKNVRLISNQMSYLYIIRIYLLFGDNSSLLSEEKSLEASHTVNCLPLSLSRSEYFTEMSRICFFHILCIVTSCTAHKLDYGGPRELWVDQNTCYTGKHYHKSA